MFKACERQAVGGQSEIIEDGVDRLLAKSATATSIEKALERSGATMTLRTIGQVQQKSLRAHSRRSRPLLCREH